MVGRSAKGYEQLAMVAERCEPVTNALFGLRRYGLDRLAKFLERDSLISAHGCKILVDGLGDR